MDNTIKEKVKESIIRADNYDIGQYTAENIVDVYFETLAGKIDPGNITLLTSLLEEPSEQTTDRAAIVFDFKEEVVKKIISSLTDGQMDEKQSGSIAVQSVTTITHLLKEWNKDGTTNVVSLVEELVGETSVQGNIYQVKG